MAPARSAGTSPAGSPGAGVDHLVLTSRRGADAPGATELTAELEALGARVTVAACDMTDRAAVAAVVAEHPPTAVFHAAGTELVRMIDEHDPAEFDAVLAAKITGARHLDELVGDVAAFVLFSSISATWGSGAQAAYSAANAALDGLAEARSARGAAALSVAWGPWAGGGMADAEATEQLRLRGVAALPAERAVAALRESLAQKDVTVTVADVDWERFAAVFTAARPSPLLQDLPEVHQAPRVAGPDRADLLGELAALNPMEQDRMLMDLVRSRVAAVLGHSGIDAVQPDRAFSELGFDSLSAVELRDSLGSSTGLPLPATLTYDYPTSTALVEYLRAQLELDDKVLTPVLDELDLLENAVATTELDPEARATVVARLQALLSRCTPTGDGSVSITDKLDAADDDEMFALIDQEFGA